MILEKEIKWILLLRNIQLEKKGQQMQGALSIFNIYNRNNGIEHDNNLIRRALHIWKKNAKKKQIENATKIINSNARIF